MQQDLLYKTSYRVKPDALIGAVIEISTSWDYYFVSGGTTITGIKTGYPGMQVCLEFKTETTLIQSSTLDLPAGEDLVAVIGDVYRFCETILGTWKCISGGGKSGGGSISDDPYGAGWDSETTTGASQNALYAKMETFANNGLNTDITSMRGFDRDQHGGNVYVGNENTGLYHTGKFNFFLGGNVGKYGSGDNNLYLGQDTGEGLNPNGDSGNTFVGHIAGGSSSYWSNSVMIGIHSGSTVASGAVNGYESIYIGASSKVGINGGKNEIVIGYLTLGHGDNTTTIGNDENTNTYLHGDANVSGAVVAGTDIVVNGSVDLLGGRIEFPISATPESDPTTLDAYEEGTFTPTISFGGTSADIAYSINTGEYTKIGNVVNYIINITLSFKGNASGNLELTGLPFTTANNGLYTCGSLYWEQVNYVDVPMMYIIPNDNRIRFGYQVLNSGIIRLTDANMENTSKFRIQGSYFTE